jgi:hypothetical protein
MEMKITFKKLQDKWSLSFGRGIVKREVPVLFSRLERRLSQTMKEGATSASLMKDKTCVIVKYGKEYSNKTLVSRDPFYLLYTTSCFLEDYLSAKTIKRAYNAYVN